MRTVVQDHADTFSLHPFTKQHHLQETFISLLRQGLHLHLPAGVTNAAPYLKGLLASIIIFHAGRFSCLFLHVSQL